MELLSKRIDYEVNTLKWNPIAINRKAPKISHLFFADDLTLFAQANQKNCDTIKRTLDSFSKFSSQKINRAKSKVLFSKNCSSHTINNLASQLNIQARDTFGKFLGFLIFHRNPTKAEFWFILDNMKAKLVGWKIRFLNQAGRTTLSRASLNSISNHVMHYIAIPKNITNQIDRIQRNFIWGTTNSVKKMHMVGWKMVTNSKAREVWVSKELTIKNLPCTQLFPRD